MTPSPEQLAAYADGQLDAADAAQVEAAISRDPVMARQVAAHRALRARLAGHFAPVAEEPVPERLSALLRSSQAEVIDFAAAARARTRPRFRWTWVAGPALAASLVLALTLRGPATRTYASDEIASALDSQLVAEQPGDAPVRVLLSFRDRSGDICRAYAAGRRSGIACRDDRGWKMQGGSGGPEAETSEYRQAASAGDILARAQAMASGPALDAQEEARARALGWKRATVQGR